MMHVGDTMSTSGDVQYIGVYHEYIGGYHEYIGANITSTSGFSVEIERLLSTCSPTCIMISSRCTHGILRCTERLPPMH